MNRRSYTSWTFVCADGGEGGFPLSYSNLRSQTRVFLLLVTQGVLVVAGQVSSSVTGQCKSVFSGEEVIHSPESSMSLGLAV